MVPRYENKPSPASPLRKSAERSAANGACSPERDRPTSLVSKQWNSSCLLHMTLSLWVQVGQTYQCDNTSGLCCSNQNYYLMRFKPDILLKKTHKCGYFLFMVCLSTLSAAQATSRRMEGLVNVNVHGTLGE